MDRTHPRVIPSEPPDEAPLTGAAAQAFYLGLLKLALDFPPLQSSNPRRPRRQHPRQRQGPRHPHLHRPRRQRRRRMPSQHRRHHRHQLNTLTKKRKTVDGPPCSRFLFFPHPKNQNASTSPSPGQHPANLQQNLNDPQNHPPPDLPPGPDIASPPQLMEIKSPTGRESNE